MCDAKGLPVSTEWAVATPQRRCCHGICRGVRTSQFRAHPRHAQGLLKFWYEPNVDANSLSRQMFHTCARAKRGNRGDVGNGVEVSEDSYLSLFGETQDYIVKGSEKSSPAPIRESFANRPGRKKGFKLGPEAIVKISQAMKGKNTKKKTAQHKSRISQSMRKAWKKRRKSGKPTRLNTVTCSLCGERGHNKRTCPYVADRDKATKTVRLCTYCQKPGHYRKNCPELKKDVQALQQQKMKLANGEPKLPAVGGIKGAVNAAIVVQPPVPMPVRSKDIWRQAAGAAIRAWRDGVKRHKIESMLPILKVEAEMDPMDWPGGMRQQLKVATPLAECVLRGLKAQSGLDGVLRPQFLDSVDAVAMWKSKTIAAVLFPQPDSVDTLLAMSTKQREGLTPELMLMFNPQWQPGQVISDFGYGVLKDIREDFVDTFEDVFFMRRINIFSDSVILLRCYPFDWQVHFIHPSGASKLIGVSSSRPSFSEIRKMVKELPGSLNSLNWIDKLQRQYTPGRRASDMPSFESQSASEERNLIDETSAQSFGRLDLPADAFIPDYKELKQWGESASSIDTSKTLIPVNNLLPEGDSRFDIVTGVPVRDVMRDPVTQFRSFFDVFGSEDERPESDEDEH